MKILASDEIYYLDFVDLAIASLENLKYIPRYNSTKDKTDVEKTMRIFFYMLNEYTIKRFVKVLLSVWKALLKLNLTRQEY